MLTHIKEDWLLRLPYRVRYNPYRGLSRSCYALLCLMYYTVKDLLLLFFYMHFRLLKFVLYDLWMSLYFRINSASDEEIDEEYEEAIEDEATEELPFCQLFRIGEQMSLLIDHIEMCPDETAFIRVVDDEGYTPLYKRKVRRDKAGNRFIVFNGTNHYLNEEKTQPTTLKK